MSDCTSALLTDITFDCANAPIGGIEQNVLIVKKKDITGVTYDNTRPLVVTNITLTANAPVCKLEGLKQANGKAWELVKKENAPDKYKHTFSGVIFNPSAANKQNAATLADGAKYVIIIEQMWKGSGSADAFEILGLHSGLEMSTMTNSSKENDNMIMFEMASVDSFEEPTPPKNFMKYTTNTPEYAATKALFDNQLVPVTAP
jgi:hypothetical protein